MNIDILRRFPSKQRKILLALLDFLILFVIFLTFKNKLFQFQNSSYYLQKIFYFFINPLMGISLFAITGQYRSLTRYATSKTAYYLALRNLLYVTLLLLSSFSLGLKVKEISSFYILWLLLICLIGGVRFILRDFLHILNKNKKYKSESNAVIYGAGSAGVELLMSIKNSGEKKIICFIDDNHDLWGRSIDGIPIRSPESLKELRNVPKSIYLAIPSISKSEYRKIFYKASKYSEKILQVPSLGDIANGNARIDSLRPLDIEDILGRDEANPDESLLRINIENKCILITGAGGSVGSELCRQILKRNPLKLILLDLSEASLHKIHQELIEYFPSFQNLEVILGNASNEKLVEDIIIKFNIDIIYHAGAYKHVPLVEINPIEGILNNVGSTNNLCKLSLKYNIEKFVLISTDKAVRPTNVMGASKRVCELIVQSFASISNQYTKNQLKKFTIFSLVRFGNVLRSSGSVVPIFEKQIKRGGPVIVTHPEINRFFMTIEEAACLVLQSSSLAEGGEVFLLDMGKPVKILDLAKKMITLSGCSIKDENNPSGDIEIIFSGLRKGEKLFEELLLEGNPLKTLHPLIFKSCESLTNNQNVLKKIDNLLINLASYEKKESLKLLREIVPEWKGYDFKNI